MKPENSDGKPLVQSILFYSVPIVGLLAFFPPSSIRNIICEQMSFGWCAQPYLEKAQLADVINHSDIVMFGESDHYLAETFDFRLMITTSLIENGFKNFVFEYGAAQLEFFERYVNTGEQRWLDPNLGSAFLLDPAIPNFKCPVSEIACGFQKATRDYWEAVRNLKQKHFAEEEVRLIGIDYDHIRPNLAFAMIEEIVANLSKTELRARLAQAVSSIESDDVNSAFDAATKVLDLLQMYHSGLPENSSERKALDDALTWGYHLLESIRFRISARNEKEISPRFQLREKYLLQNAQRAIELIGQEKLAISAHLIHIAKDPTSIRVMQGKDAFFHYWQTFASGLEQGFTNRIVKRIFMINGPGMTLNPRDGLAIESSQFPDIIEFSRVSNGEIHKVRDDIFELPYRVGAGSPALLNLWDQTDYVALYRTSSLMGQVLR